MDITALIQSDVTVSCDLDGSARTLCCLLAFPHSIGYLLTTRPPRDRGPTFSQQERYPVGERYSKSTSYKPVGNGVSLVRTESEWGDGEEIEIKACYRTIEFSILDLLSVHRLLVGETCMAARCHT